MDLFGSQTAPLSDMAPCLFGWVFLYISQGKIDAEIQEKKEGAGGIHAHRKIYNKSNELLNSFSTLEPVSPSKSSGPLAKPVVPDLFFNIAKYIFHFGLIIYYTTCCGRSTAKADYIEKGIRL
jgi:hypothetical protein